MEQHLITCDCKVSGQECTSVLWDICYILLYSLLVFLSCCYDLLVVIRRFALLLLLHTSGAVVAWPMGTHKTINPALPRALLLFHLLFLTHSQRMGSGRFLSSMKGKLFSVVAGNYLVKSLILGSLRCLLFRHHQDRLVSL